MPPPVGMRRHAYGIPGNFTGGVGVALTFINPARHGHECSGNGKGVLHLLDHPALLAVAAQQVLLIWFGLPNSVTFVLDSEL